MHHVISLQHGPDVKLVLHIDDFNPLLDVPILGSSSSTANKE